LFKLDMSLTTLPIESFIPLDFITPTCKPVSANSVQVFVTDQTYPRSLNNGPALALIYDASYLLWKQIPGPYQGILFNRPAGGP